MVPGASAFARLRPAVLTVQVDVDGAWTQRRAATALQLHRSPRRRGHRQQWRRPTTAREAPKRACADVDGCLDGPPRSPHPIGPRAGRRAPSRAPPNPGPSWSAPLHPRRSRPIWWTRRSRSRPPRSRRRRCARRSAPRRWRPPPCGRRRERSTPRIPSRACRPPEPAGRPRPNPRPCRRRRAPRRDQGARRRRQGTDAPPPTAIVLAANPPPPLCPTANPVSARGASAKPARGGETGRDSGQSGG